MIKWLKSLFKKTKKSNPLSWNDMEFFRPNEFNYPDKISLKHIQKLDFLRKQIGTRIVVTSDYRDGKTGWHPEGLATDLIAPTLGLAGLFNLYLAAEKAGFAGIGFYVDWEYYGTKTGGLHLDSRPLDKYGYGARWLCFKNREGIQQYVALNKKNLMQYYFNRIN